MCIELCILERGIFPSTAEEDEVDYDSEEDYSSSASDGVFSPTVSRNNSNRSHHSRQSSYGSAKVKVTVRRYKNLVSTCLNVSLCDVSFIFLYFEFLFIILAMIVLLKQI